MAKKKAPAKAKSAKSDEPAAAAPAQGNARVRVGQTWKDNDDRSGQDRRFNVLQIDEEFYGGGRALCQLITGTKRQFWAKLNRFNGTKRGYSLVEEKGA